MMLKRDIRQLPVSHGDIIERVPKSDVYQQRYLCSALSVKDGDIKRAFFNIVFDQGFLFYTTDNTLDNCQRVELMAEQRSLYIRSQLPFKFLS